MSLQGGGAGMAISDFEIAMLRSQRQELCDHKKSPVKVKNIRSQEESCTIYLNRKSRSISSRAEHDGKL